MRIYDPGISESERQRRKKSNKISTKINFFAWTIEVPASSNLTFDSEFWKQIFPQLAGSLFMVLPTPIPLPARKILNRQTIYLQKCHRLVFCFWKIFARYSFTPRLMNLCMTPLFYIMAAEKERLVSALASLHSLFCRHTSNSVSPATPTLPWAKLMSLQMTMQTIDKLLNTDILDKKTFFYN